jgi:CHRD domain
MGVRRYVRLTAGIAAVAVLGVGAVATAHGGRNGFKERLSGFEEVPAISTTGSGRFRAHIERRGDEINYRLTFSGLQAPITQSHIHFGNAGTNGGIVLFLCTNLNNGPAGTQLCPTNATQGTIEGTLDAADVVAVAAQGIAAGEFDEVLRAIRADATYVNVHTTMFPGGEIRAQLD